MRLDSCNMCLTLLLHVFYRVLLLCWLALACAVVPGICMAGMLINTAGCSEGGDNFTLTEARRQA